MTMRPSNGAASMIRCSMPGLADAFVDQVDLPVAEIGQRRIGRDLARIDGDMRAHADRQLAPAGVEIGRDDRRDAHQLEPGDHAEADRAAADDQRGIVLGRSPAPGMLEPDGERLDHRRMIVVEVAGNLDHHVLVEQHQFAEAAGAFVAVADHRVRARPGA